MLLMQYNDNIPAVFGFPRVIPHQRRGGTKEEEDRGRTLLFWPQLAVFVLLAVSLLFIVPPSSPVSTTGTVYLAASVCIIEQQHIIVGCFFFWLYQFGTCMGKKQITAINVFLTHGVHYPQSSNTWSPIWPVCVRQEATDGCRRPVHTAPFISWAPQHMAFLRLLLTMGG